MKQKIITYVKEAYNPQAILLHGSRASGYATENSDWDFYVLDERELESETERKFGAEIDVKARQLPIKSDEDIEKEFGPELKHAKVVFDTGGVGEELLARAKKFYAQGRNLSDEQIRNRKNMFRRVYFRVKERSSAIAHLYRVELVSRAVRYWYEIEKNDWHDNFYIAFPYIESEDSNYHERLMQLLESSSREQYVKSAGWVYERLFGEGLEDL